jgi:ubiquinone/menaquinone biosynthesis C-methylase UbiE
VSFEEVKERHRVAWGKAPFETVEGSIAAMHDDVVQRLGPKPGENWLDVGCGAGAVSMRAARAGAKVTGVDISDGMIETARRRADEEGLDIAYQVGDAEQLPVGDASFDVVSSSVGFIFAPNHDVAARELARVVRPGGRIGFTAWCPESRVVRGQRIAAQFGSPPPEGAGNPVDWASEEYVRELLGGAFELEFHDGDASQQADSAEELFDYLLSGVGPMRMLWDSLDPERQEEFRRVNLELYEEDRQGDQICQPGPYLLTLGRRK